MPEPDGLALYEAALRAGHRGPLLEIGSYCGKSAIYLGAAARELDTILYSLDHHRGSEEHQANEQYYDPSLVDPTDHRVDTLPRFRRTIAGARLEDVVVAVVGTSETVAAHWATPLAFLFIDGGHSEQAARTDYEGWAPHVAVGGLLAIHDVFADPRDGGQAPYRIYRRALASKAFVDVAAEASLRVLERVGNGI